MARSRFERTFQQVMWLLGSAAQLIAAMGVGLKWMIMTVRCFTFAILDIIYFLPHVFWYLLSPNIIRRVSYRSSRTTKLRNLEAFLTKQMNLEVSPTTTLSGTFAWGTKGYTSPTTAATTAGAAAAAAAHKDNGDNSLSPSLPTDLGDVDRNAVERWASAINPADGSFVSGLPMMVGSEEETPAEPRGGISRFNSSFDDAIAVLHRMYRHRSHASLAHGAASPAQHDLPVPPVPVSPAVSNASFTDSDDADDVEDRMNLHNRATLDIYLPVPLDTLFRFMDQERQFEMVPAAAHTKRPQHRPQALHQPEQRRGGAGSAACAAAGEASTPSTPPPAPPVSSQPRRSSSDRKHRSKLMRKKFPIIISMTGGAWIIGCYLWNFLLARLFAARGYVVFCPDYRNFPQTTMEGMTLDVSDAIAWVLNNAERYNGDLDNVTVIGQSAGAHLTMMSILSQAQLSAYRYNSERGLHEDVPPPSDVAYNVPRYHPRASIHRYIGLSGIFNVAGLVRHFNRRGLYRDVLYQIAGGKANMERYTLNAYFDDRSASSTGEVLPDNIFDFFPQRMFFIHGDADASAPVSESANLVYVMRCAQRDAIVKAVQENPERAKTLPKPVTFEYILVPGATHTDSIIEEPLCGNSHIVEFLCYYDIDDDERRHAQLTGLLAVDNSTAPNAVAGGGGGGGVTHSRSSSSANGGGESSVSRMMGSDAYATASSPILNGLSPDTCYRIPFVPATRPDGILLSPCPAPSRRRLMRLASYICPF